MCNEKEYSRMRCSVWEWELESVLESVLVLALESVSVSELALVSASVLGSALVLV